MMKTQLCPASLEHVDVLAHMNAQLIIDEHSPNTMTETELADRMRRWLTGGDYKAILILNMQDEIIGYLIYFLSKDAYYPYQETVHVRQFFIKRNYRRRGIGQATFERIVEDYFPPGVPITLDVLESNPEGREFWFKIGFEVYHTTMKRQTPTD